MDRARLPIKGTSFESERMENAKIVRDVKVSREVYLKSFETLEEDIMPTDIQANGNWYTETVSDLLELMGDLQECEFISDVAPDELDSLNDAESSLPICVAPSIGDTMDCGVACAIENFENQFLDDNQDDEEIDVLSDVAEEKKGSLKDVVDAAKALGSEIQICFEDRESILKDGMADELMRLLLVKISALQIHCRKRAKQARIDQFVSATKSSTDG